MTLALVNLALIAAWLGRFRANPPSRTGTDPGRLRLRWAACAARLRCARSRGRDGASRGVVRRRVARQAGRRRTGPSAGNARGALARARRGRRGRRRDVGSRRGAEPRLVPRRGQAVASRGAPDRAVVQVSRGLKRKRLPRPPHASSRSASRGVIRPTSAASTSRRSTRRRPARTGSSRSPSAAARSRRRSGVSSSASTPPHRTSATGRSRRRLRRSRARAATSRRSRPRAGLIAPSTPRR